MSVSVDVDVESRGSGRERMKWGCEDPLLEKSGNSVRAIRFAGIGFRCLDVALWKMRRRKVMVWRMVSAGVAKWKPRW